MVRMLECWAGSSFLLLLSVCVAGSLVSICKISPRVCSRFLFMVRARIRSVLVGPVPGCLAAASRGGRRRAFVPAPRSPLVGEDRPHVSPVCDSCRGRILERQPKLFGAPPLLLLFAQLSGGRRGGCRLFRREAPLLGQGPALRRARRRRQQGPHCTARLRRVKLLFHTVTSKRRAPPNAPRAPLWGTTTVG